MVNEKLDLLNDFPAISKEQWLEVVTKDLKGADFNKRLVWKTNEQINLMPFYRKEDIEGMKSTDLKPATFPYIRSTKPNNEWYIRQEIPETDPKAINIKALDILNKGITSLGIRVKKDLLSREYIATLLQDIEPTAVELNFSVCVKGAAKLLMLLTEYYQEKGYMNSPELLHGSVNVDVFNEMLKKGKLFNKTFVMGVVKETMKSGAMLPNYRVIGVNGLTLNNAGANAVQELAYSLAWGNDYLAEMIDAGIEKEEAAKNLKFIFGVGSNYFIEIAKFRAARLLWATIVKAYYGDNANYEEAAKMRIHAETSMFNMTIFDAHVNLLRTQTEAMSATIAGVDSLTVKPFDSAFDQPNDFSERIARNQQLLLKEESHFDRIIDPAAGSYYIENLTKELAQKAWDMFLAIEDKGGFYELIKSGEVQADMKATADAREQALAKRKEILLGTNQYPNFTEKAASKIKEKQAHHACGSHHNETSIPKIGVRRAADEFEQLRLATENSGKNPKVFMLTIGNLAMRLARSQFSSNFFACAGYQIIDNLGFKTVAEGVEAAMAAKADIVVICSSDDEYAEYAPEAFNLIADRALMVVAGAPQCADELKAKGIENFINVRSNVYETLKMFNEKLLS